MAIRASALDLLPISANLLYWRTTGGEEGDFVIGIPSRLPSFEVKISRTLGVRDVRGLVASLGEYPGQAAVRVVAYGGREWLRPARGIVAIPRSALLGS